MIRLGYAGKNNTLSEQGIITNKTIRLQTVYNKELEQTGSGFNLLKELFISNLQNILKVLKWNIKNKIYFYRLPSDIAPHLTNPLLMKKKDKKDPYKLAYSILDLKPIFKQIGDLAQKHNVRLTFHPDLFTVLNSPDPNITIKTHRDLYMHTLFLDYMELDYNSIIVLHGGGVYGNKEQAINRWVQNFNKMPDSIKRRIVIENDEYNYSISDVLKISNLVRKFPLYDQADSPLVQLPVVFDIFHYYCYEITVRKRKEKGIISESQPPIRSILPEIIQTWSVRKVKMHISEQAPDAPFGAHCKYVREIPDIIWEISRSIPIDLMIEAKEKEKAVFRLRNKYKNII